MDHDCSGSPYDKDTDNDGYMDDACVGGTDCDDTNPTINPGADEGCDGIDTDCDGLLGALETDDDGDLMTECAGDCNDLDPLTYLGAPEQCDFRDNDCDGTADEGACMLIEALALIGLATCLMNPAEPPPPPVEDDDGGGGGGGGCALYYRPLVGSALASSVIVYIVPVAFIVLMKRRVRRHSSRGGESR